MIAGVTVRGWGPCDELSVSLDPEGDTTLIGPSESGKSTLVEAVCFVVTGRDTRGRAVDVEVIREGCKRLEVVVTTGRGTEFYRSLSPSRSTIRRLGDETFDSDAAMLEALGPLGRQLPANKRQVSAAQLVMAPMSWVALAESTLGGAELRDVLSALVPVDLAEYVAGALQEAGFDLDPKHAEIDAKGAERVRADARAAATRAEGVLQEAQRAISAIAKPAAPPNQDELVSARAVLDAAHAWEDHTEELRAFERAEKAIADWRARRAALGEEPPPPDEGRLQAARERFSAAKDAKTSAEATTLPEVPPESERLRTARAELEQASRELARLEAAGPVCPTCSREWDDAARALDQASTRVTGLREEVRMLADDEDEVRKKAETARKKAETARKKAIERAQSEMDEARTEGEEQRELERAHKAYKAGVLAAGVCPQSLPRPEQPAAGQPSAQDVEAARRALSRHATATGAVEQYELQMKAADDAVFQAAQKAEAAQERSRYAEELLTAVRRAPGLRLEEGMGALGDLGPVSLEVTDTGVKVLVDGRSYHLASRGRLVCADVWFRAALRRALDMVWLPVWVDDAASWTGEWPDLDGPVVYLVTRPTEALEVA